MSLFLWCCLHGGYVYFVMFYGDTKLENSNTFILGTIYYIATQGGLFSSSQLDYTANLWSASGDLNLDKWVGKEREGS